MIKPLGDRVLVQLINEEEKTIKIALTQDILDRMEKVEGLEIGMEVEMEEDKFYTIFEEKND